MRPIEYQRRVRGFGVWRIVYDVTAKQWRLDLNDMPSGKERWRPVGMYNLADVAAIHVHEKTTGLGVWDECGFDAGESFSDLAQWRRMDDEG